jgi:hypothetical protein
MPTRMHSCVKPLINPALAQYAGFGGGPKLIAPNGQYLGRLNSNRLIPDSASNPLGRSGSPLSPDSINPGRRAA